MDFKERKEKFYNRFGIEDDIPEPMALKGFRTGIKNYLADIDTKIQDDDVKRYCSLFGFEVNWVYDVLQRRSGKNIYECICGEADWIKYLHKIQELFYLKIHASDPSGYNNTLFTRVKELIVNSKLTIDIIQSQEEYLIYPAGSSFLDNELIVAPLKFLDEKSHGHFIQGLKSYSNKNETDYRKAAESMRRTLEEYLRVIFNNDKGLKENIVLIGKALKELKKQAEIKSLFHSFFDYLDKFYNENSKHNDGDIGEAECELIILETGLLIKYLDRIKLDILGESAKK